MKITVENGEKKFVSFNLTIEIESEQDAALMYNLFNYRYFVDMLNDNCLTVREKIYEYLINKNLPSQTFESFVQKMKGN